MEGLSDVSSARALVDAATLVGEGFLATMFGKLFGIGDNNTEVPATAFLAAKRAASFESRCERVSLLEDK